MKSENKKKIAISTFILLSIFILDRVSKILILNILDETGQVDIYINSFLNFYLVWNKGIGFGLLSSDQDLFYNVVTFVIILINFVIIYLLFQETGLKSEHFGHEYQLRGLPTLAWWRYGLDLKAWGYLQNP